MDDMSFDAAEVLPQTPISLTFARSKTDFRWSDRRTMTFSDLARMLSRSPVGNKDGACYTPAVFSGTVRSKEYATRIDIAVLDADCGHTFEDICAAVRSRRWRAIVHSTYSHLSDTTVIAADAADKWLAENSQADIGQYMLAKKGYLPAVVAGSKLVEEVRDGNSRSYLIKHQPCPKFRIILPLQDAWVAEQFENQTIANSAWRERIGALAHALELNHDQSCVDTSRLFYMPRGREGVEYDYTVLDGDECPLWTLPEYVPPAPLLQAIQAALPVAAGPQLVRPDHVVYRAPNDTWIDLTSWAAAYGTRFEIVTALRDKAPGVIASRRSGVKWHIACPHASDHITGGADKTGTYAVNASQVAHAGLASVNGFTVHCMHNGCAGRDRLSFLHKLLCDGSLSIPDLTDPAFLVPDDTQVEIDLTVGAEDDGERAPNVTPDLYTGLPSVMHEIHEYLCMTSVKPQPCLALGGALAIMASAIGRRVQLQHWGTLPNIYIVSIGHSGCGKERVLSGTKNIARAAGLYTKMIGVEEVASDAGIISSVMQSPSQVILLDEVDFLINATHNQKNGAHIVNVISTLLRLFTSAHTSFKSKAYADIKKVEVVDRPCVSLYGCSTSRGLFTALSSKDINSGLMSRIVVFNAGDYDPRGRPAANVPVPQIVVDWMLAWDRMLLDPDMLSVSDGMPSITPITVMMTPEALAISEQFTDEMHDAKKAARKVGMDALYVRAGENALKFALIRACCVPPIKTDSGPVIDTSRLCVDAETMRWATMLSRATVLSLVESARTEIADTPFEVKRKAFLEMIRRGGASGMTFRDMGRNQAGRLPQKERDDIIRILRECGDIHFIENVNEGKRGKPRQAYVHAKFVKEKDE